MTRPFHEELRAVETFSFTSASLKVIEPTEQWPGVIDMPTTLSKLGLSRYRVFNGGFYFFRADEHARAIFDRTRDIRARWRELGLSQWDAAGPNDETCFALALEALDMPQHLDGARIMKTPIGMSGNLAIDPLGGGTRFVKLGVPVEPAICHFSNRTGLPEYEICERLLRGQSAGPVVRALIRGRARFKLRVRGVNRRLRQLADRFGGQAR